MTLNLAVKMTLDKAGFVPSAEDAAKAIGGIGGASKRAADDARVLATTVVEAGRAATSAAEAQARAIQSIAAATARGTSPSVAGTRVDQMGMTISRSSSAVAADVASLGEVLDQVRARWDPLYAATRRYETLLGEVGAAHAVGAIDARTLIARQLELKAAFERTTSSMADQGRVAKLAVQRSVAGQTVTPDRGADIAAYGAELDGLRAKYNPLWAAEQRHQATIADIGRSQRVGAISSDEATAAIARQTAQHRREVEALKTSEAALSGHAGQMKLTALQAQGLSYQLNDVVVSLASGMNPLTVLVQQGSQITPIFGGVRATLGAVAGVLSGTTAGVVALVAGFGLAAKAALDYDAATRRSSVAAGGLGRNAGLTGGDLETTARRTADVAEVSVSSARTFAVEYGRTGKIGTAVMGELIAITKDFAATTVTEVDAAAKTLADLFADPGRGAEFLAQSLGLVDSATERLVKRLAEQNRISDAQSTLVAALGPRLVKAADATNIWAQSWERAGRAISNAWDALGRGATSDVVTPNDSLEAARKKVAALEKLAARAPAGSAVRQDAEADLGREKEKLALLEKQTDERRKQGVAAESDRAGRAAVGVAGASGAASVRDSLRIQQMDTERGVLDGAGRATNVTPLEQQRIADALDAKTRALRTWISEADRAAAIDRIDLAVIQARDPIERAALEAERARITTAGQEMTTREAATAVERAYARALGETIAQTRGSIADITADAAARTRVNALVASGALATGDAARELAIEAQTRQLVAAAARAEGAEKERLLALAGSLRSAIIAQSEAEKAAAAISDLRTGRDRIETLQAEIATLGQSEPLRARNLALLEGEQKIRSQGLTGTLAAETRAQAAAAADLNTVLERQKSAWEEIKTTGGGAIDTLVDGLRTGKDVSQQLADDLLKETLKLAVANPLKNAIFGQNLPTASGVGGLLGNLFGGSTSAGLGAALPASVATASITAGTVIVNGGVGVGGLAGGVGGLAAVNSNGGVADGYVRRLFQVESGGDPNNKTGSNLGLAQFSYADMKQFGLSNPLDPAEATRATILEAQRNAGPLASILGRAASPGEMYLSHQQGLAGASALFRNPDQPAWQAIRPYYGSDQIAQRAITGNGGSVDMTSKQFSDMWVKKFENGMDGASQGLAGLSAKSNSAVDALGQFSPATTQATNALTNSSGGIAQASNQMGSTITSTATTTQSAFGQLTSGLGSAISSLFSGLGNMLGGIGGGIGKLFGFDDGGYTGSADRTAIAGFVHGQEFVVNAHATARHRGLLEALNDNRLPGYASGGFVAAIGDTGARRAASASVVFMAAAPGATASGPGWSAGSGAGGGFSQTIVNNSRAEVSTREESDGKGGRRQTVVIEEMVGQAIGRPRSATQKALVSAFGLRSKVIRR